MTSSFDRSALRVALLSVAVALSGHALAGPIQTVFVIAMENENFVQPANKFTASNEQIFQNPNAPFINSLISGTATAVINGTLTNLSQQTAYAGNYNNVLANASGTSHIHPSEPNYIWSEAGSNLGVLNDNAPFGPGGTNQNTTAHLSTYLTQAGKSWKSYQEGIDLTPGANGKPTNAVLPQSQWTVPLNNFSGSNPGGYTNPYNGSSQFDYAVKHNPMAFFTDTNGGNNTTPSNPLSQNYAPLEQLQTDLNNNTVAKYNWITPDQFNDMHTALTGTFQGLTATGDKRIKQGDNFLSQIVPIIMASEAYQNDGAIILWWDETEPDGVAGDNPDNFSHLLTEIIISPDAHPNVGGLPYESMVSFTHSSDLLTMQEVFNVGPLDGVRDAANATDLSDLFAAGSIPARVPEPGTIVLALAGLGLMRIARRRAQK
jgi:hypothetical protein